MSVKHNNTDIMTLHSKTPRNIELGASGCSENASIYLRKFISCNWLITFFWFYRRVTRQLWLVIIHIVSYDSQLSNCCLLFVIDRNECNTTNHGCHANATCTNTHGSYACICKPGFDGNGTDCIGKSMCLYILEFYKNKHNS